jgi:hypothetical protein
MTFTATLPRHTLTYTFGSLIYMSLLVYSIEQSTFCFLRLCPLYLTCCFALRAEEPDDFDDDAGVARLVVADTFVWEPSRKICAMEGLRSGVLARVAVHDFNCNNRRSVSV